MLHVDWATTGGGALAGGVATVSVASVLAAGVSDELSSLIGVVATVLAPILMAMAGALAFVFRTLVAEMRTSREQAKSQADELMKVVSANTAAMTQNTEAQRSLAQAVERLESRVSALEQHDDDLHTRRVAH